MTYCEKREVKNETALLFGLFCVVANLPAQDFPPMVAHFPLDEGAGAEVTDAVSGAMGVLNKPEGSWITGKIGGALGLDGESARVHVPHNAAFDFAGESFTIAYWMRMQTGITAHHPHQLTKGDYEASEVGGGVRWEFHFEKGAMNFTLDDGTNKSEASVSPGVYQTGEWVHVVGVRDTANKKLLLYADGVVQEITSPGDGVDYSGSIANPVDLVIGDASRDDNPFPGDLDDIRFFRQALTADQIAGVMADTAGTTSLRFPHSAPHLEKMTLRMPGLDKNSAFVNRGYHSMEIVDVRGRLRRQLPVTPERFLNFRGATGDRVGSGVHFVRLHGECGCGRLGFAAP